MKIGPIGIFVAFAAWGAAAQMHVPQQTPLVLSDIGVDRQTLANGKELVAVSGRVVNPTGESHRVPNIEAAIRNKSGALMYSWEIEPPTAALAAGQSATFESAEVDVPPSGLDSTLIITLLDGTVAPAFYQWLTGNWVPQGQSCESDAGVRYNPDGTWQAYGAAGTWRLEGSSIVSTVTEKWTEEAEEAVPVSERHVEHITVLGPNAYQSRWEDGTIVKLSRCSTADG